MTNHHGKNYLRRAAGIFIAATVGFLLVAAIGAYWAMGFLNTRTSAVAAPASSAAATQTIKVYFGNANLNKEMLDCGLVYPVERQVVKTPAVARAALLELLAGPTLAESNGGYFTSINPGVKLNYIGIVGDVARVDFDKKMDESMGGSCRVTAIRAQITRTLMQFPTVKSVVISVDGNSEEALQP